MTAPRRLLAFAAGFAFLISASANGTAQELTLKAAVFVPPSTTYGIPFKRFVDHVNETGKGVLQIRIVGGPEAVPADGQAQAVTNRRARHRVDPDRLLQEPDGRGRRAGAQRPVGRRAAQVRRSTRCSTRSPTTR